MSVSPPVVFILGSGANLGAGIAKAFAAKGYKVAHSSRNADPKKNNKDEIFVPLDLTDPSAIAGAFAHVKEQLGIPSVVVYNAANGAFVDLSDPASLPLEDFATSLTVNTTSLYAAIQEAVKSFGDLPIDASKTFIFTGNALNNIAVPPMLPLGVGKAASAHLIDYISKAYVFRGFKFYYADQRTADGAGAYFGVNADAHGKHYVSLSEHPSQQIWLQTFTPESGYQRFKHAV